MNLPPVFTPAFDETCAKKTRCENRWTAAEDKILFAQVQKANGRSVCWRSVAAALPGRNNKSCRKRWIHSLNPGLRKGRWTPSEDAALADAVKVHGKHWFQVARTLNNGRTDDQCAKRWREALDPDIERGPWAEHENEKLIAMFRIHGRRWNDIASSLQGRPPVQCRNRWLSLVRAGRVEDTPPLKPEFREDLMFHPPAPESGVVDQAMFNNSANNCPAPVRFSLRRTSWEGHRPDNSNGEIVECPRLYPPTYPEGRYHGRFASLTRTMDLVAPGYCPPPHGSAFSPSPHVSPEETQPPIPQPLHVVAPTPVNLVIQTNFTRVQHNYHYAVQDSDTSPGYGPTPPVTASSTRSSFSFSSAGSPTTPFDQTQEHAAHYNSQNYPAPHIAYLPHMFCHRCNVANDRYHQTPPLSGGGGSPCDDSICKQVDSLHEAYYPPVVNCESPDHSSEYGGEPEPQGNGWVTHSVPGYELYSTQNQTTGAWRHPPWPHPVVINCGSSEGDEVCHSDTVTTSRFVEHPTGFGDPHSH